MVNHTTGSQRYNTRMDKIFEEAKRLNAIQDQKEIIMKKLIDDDFNFIKGGEYDYLMNLMRNGFVGYNNQTLEELKQELQERELE